MVRTRHRARVLASVFALRDAMASCACVALEAAQMARVTATIAHSQRWRLWRRANVAGGAHSWRQAKIWAVNPMGRACCWQIRRRGRDCSHRGGCASYALAAVRRGRGGCDGLAAPSSSALYSVVVLRLPAARDAAAMALRAVADVTSPGATLWACGATAEGAGPMLTAASEGELGALWKARGYGQGERRHGLGRRLQAPQVEESAWPTATWRAATRRRSQWRCPMRPQGGACGCGLGDAPRALRGRPADDMTRFLVRNLPAPPVAR